MITSILGRSRAGYPKHSGMAVVAGVLFFVAHASDAEVLRIFAGAGLGTAGGKITTTTDVGPNPPELLFSLSDDLEGMDIAADKLYFVDGTAGELRRSNLDGSSPVTIVSPVSSAGIGLDLVNQKVYFVDGTTIRRANLDGSTQQTAVTGVSGVSDIAIDAAGGKIYWVELNNGLVKRANLNGTSVQTLVTGDPDIGPVTVALDVSASKMYWTELTEGVRRANLDGTSPETVVPIDSGLPVALILDLAASKVYWSAFGPSQPIRRANLDGTGIEELFLPEAEAGFIAFNAAEDTLYWEDGVNVGSGVRRIQFPDVSIVKTGLNDPAGIEVLNDRVYYINTDGQAAQLGVWSIHRMNFDGTGDVTLVSNLELPVDLALDPSGGKMYWSDVVDGVYRADLDGTDVELIVPGASSPVWLDLDLANGKVYWTALALSDIRRANLDGSNEEEVLPGLSNPSGIEIHPGLSKVYFGENAGGISRANLDGSNLEVVLAYEDAGEAAFIAFDEAAGKMYWTDNDSPLTRRANVDGSNIEEIMTSYSIGSFALVTQGLSEAWVNFAHVGAEWGTQVNPFNSLAEGLASVRAAGLVSIVGNSGDPITGEKPTINQSVVIRAVGGTVRIGQNGGRSAPGASGFVAPR